MPTTTKGKPNGTSITTSDLYVTDLELPCYRTHLDSLREKGSNVSFLWNSEDSESSDKMHRFEDKSCR
jgi:hypothetical protein